MPSPRVAAVLLAAGRGTRFSAEEFKLGVALHHTPILTEAASRLLHSSKIDAVICVIPRDPVDAVTVGIFTQHVLQSTKGLRPVVGGEERADSVLAALDALPESVEVVAIHDGARPFVPVEFLDQAIDLVLRCEADGVAPGQPIGDTIKRVGSDGAVQETVSRDGLWVVQTPQVLNRKMYHDALRSRHGTTGKPTDDIGTLPHDARIRVLLSPPDNVKLTRPDDLPLMEAIALSKWRRPPFAVGFGYDVHRLVPGRRLVLGGVELQHPDGLGLLGHSDADVLTHAIMDALLGAVDLGDIGEIFPPSDAKWKDANSIELLRHITEVYIKPAGPGRIAQIDATIVAERPKIRPHAGQMAINLARAMDMVGRGLVSIKATTNEGMGFVGREEGIAAWAVATLSL